MSLRTKSYLVIAIAMLGLIACLYASRVQQAAFSRPTPTESAGPGGAPPRADFLHSDFPAITALAVGFASLVLAAALLDLTVFSPLSALDRNLQAIAGQDDFSGRLSVAGQGQLGRLAGAINQILDALEASAQEKALRLERFRAAAEISRAIATAPEPHAILQDAIELARELFSLDSVAVYLLDERKELASLEAAAGEEAERLLAEEDRFSSTARESAVAWVIQNGRPRLVQDGAAELTLPMMSGEQLVGALRLQASRENAFEEEEVLILQTISDSIATALENSRLLRQAQANLEEIGRLHRNYLAQAWREAIHLPGGLNFTYEREEEGRGEGGETATVRIPLTLRGQEIGEVTLEVEKPGLSEEELAFAESVATQAALALENARLLKETQARAERERFLTDLSGKLMLSGDVDAILRTAIYELGSTLHATEGYIELAAAPSA